MFLVKSRKVYFFLPTTECPKLRYIMNQQLIEPVSVRFSFRNKTWKTDQIRCLHTLNKKTHLFIYLFCWLKQKQTKFILLIIQHGQNFKHVFRAKSLWNVPNFMLFTFLNVIPVALSLLFFQKRAEMQEMCVFFILFLWKTLKVYKDSLFIFLFYWLCTFPHGITVRCTTLFTPANASTRFQPQDGGVTFLFGLIFCPSHVIINGRRCCWQIFSLLLVCFSRMDRPPEQSL